MSASRRPPNICAPGASRPPSRELFGSVQCLVAVAQAFGSGSHRRLNQRDRRVGFLIDNGKRVLGRSAGGGDDPDILRLQYYLLEEPIERHATFSPNQIL